MTTTTPRRRTRLVPTVEVVRAESPLDFAQAALILGEQLALIEAIVGRELDELQPGAGAEYANLADAYSPPAGRLLLARRDGEPVGVAGVRRLDLDAPRRIAAAA